METIRNYYELSQPQKSIWYLEQKYPGTCINLIAGTLRLKGKINYDALRKAVGLAIKNNEGLRIHFRELEGEARQYLTPYCEKTIDFVDFSCDGGFDALFRWDEEQTKIPFDIIDTDLCYFAVVKIDENNGGVYAKLHHLISDAWTMTVVGNDVMTYYTAIRDDLPFDDALKPSFFEHLENEKKYEASERFVKDREYWNNKFEMCPETTVLKPQALTTDGILSKRKTFVLPQKLSNLINATCAEGNASVFTLFMSALSLYIYRVTGNEDIVLGTTTLNRIKAREKATVGMFVSVASPVRIHIDDNWNFAKLTDEMFRESLSVLKHQKYPYNYLIRDLKRQHKLDGRLYDIVLSYQNTKFVPQGNCCDFATRWHFQGYQVESLIINVNDRDDEGKFIIDYDYLIDVYDHREIEFLHSHIISLLWHALDNPQKTISRLEMLTEREKKQILCEFNNTSVSFPADKTLHDFLYEQARKTPNNTAVICGEKCLSYKDINEASNRLARLLRAKGVGPDVIVGISLYRSFEMIIGIMAILKAGGAYLPMDPDYPSDRIEYMMRDSGASILLTKGVLKERFMFDADIFAVDGAESTRYDSSDLGVTSGPYNLAYVIYTSGSTGKPKGVMVQHTGVVNRLHWGSKKFPLSESDVMLQKTPFTFDVSVWELFWWTFSGASCCMLEPGGEKEPEAILRTVETNHITHIHFVPSMLSAFLSYVEARGCASRMSSIRVFFASGEALTVRLADAFNRIFSKSYSACLYNLYGPTEATVEVSCFDCSPKVSLKTIPIGRPIDNIRLYVLDRTQNLMPVGIPGELFISGIGVARGYINNPALTAEKFLPDPFFPGERMYRTGDRVRWFPKGDIEYLGRIDFQVKIRGFRIELGEIESRLMQHSAIKEAVVIGRKHDDDNYLCAYITTKKKVEIQDVRKHLAKDLPEYMVPAFFVVLDGFPLSPNGKTDRKALPSPDFSNLAEKEFIAPQNNTEKEIAEIWQKLLGIETAGVIENFFQIGGDSLQAIALISEIHRRYDVDMPVSEVFRLQTIRRMAEYVTQSKKEKYIPIPHSDMGSFSVLSPAQERMFVLHRFDEADLSYNLPAIFRIEGVIDEARLVAAFRKLVERHESLRTYFIIEDGRPVQAVVDKIDISIEYISIEDMTVETAMLKFVRPFDLDHAPLMRVGLLTEGNVIKFLLFDMHHIIADGASVNILIRDFSALYTGTALPQLDVQYRDFSVWQKKKIEEGDFERFGNYWLTKFSGEIPVLNLPTDFSRPARKSSRGRKTSLTLNADITRELNRLAMETDTTLCMILMAAYTILLSKYSSQEDVVVGMPVEGRIHPDLKNLSGMFVNTVAVRSNPVSKKTFTAFLQEMKKTMLEAYENQEYPFEVLVDRLHVRRDLGRNPIFDTMFILQNMHLDKIPLEEAELKPIPFDTGTAKFDITLEASVHGNTIELNAEYCSELFLESTISKLLIHYVNIMKDIIIDPDKPISDIDLLSHAEKKHILTDFNQTDADFPREKTVVSLFEEQVEKTPDKIAVSFEIESVTYRELNSMANHIAHVLRGHGIRPDDIVGICVQRSIGMIAGMLGILKAGGAYLPMDPDYPQERNHFIYEDSGSKAVLTEASLSEIWPEGADVILLDITLPQQDPGNLPHVNCPSDLAYIIYTSGSTGRPKGVMIEHVNVVRLLFNDNFQYSFSCEDVWTMFHSYCFDFSVWEMYGALLYGGRLVIVSKKDAKDTAAFFRILQQEKVTVLNQTPGAFYNLIREDIAFGTSSFSPRYVIFGGEALKPALLKHYHEKHLDTKLVNMYGITETTVHVTYKEIGSDEIDRNVSNVGTAIPTLRTYILDKNLRPVPIGVPGELCVSGDGVGRGYLHNPELTAKKFVPDPFHKGGRMYRSGDLARILESGDIEYLGRIDSQVKIRGYRIELGEIESGLLSDPRISEAIVIPRENGAGDKTLYAYYVSNAEIAYEEFRVELLKRLPDYMVPSIFIRLDRIPLNRNGKMDRNSLPSRDVSIRHDTYIAPCTLTEKEIASIWEEVLELTRVGADDNFFELGGDSLSAIRVISRLNDRHSHISLAELYNNPTIRQLAAKLDSVLPGAGENEVEDAGGILMRLTTTPVYNGTNVICFPFGGGSAITYKNLADAFRSISAEYCVYAVNLPGHDFGAEEALVSLEEAAERVFGEIQKRISGKVVLYGHCVGNALLLETARLMEAAGVKVEAVFFGAIFPPKYAKLYGRFFDPWLLSSDRKIIAYLNGLGLPSDALAEDFANRVVRAFRHDARCFYRYFYRRGIEGTPRISAACHCVVGEKDSVTSGFLKKYRAWETCGETPELHVISGADHYFLSSRAEELAGIIDGACRKNNEDKHL